MKCPLCESNYVSHEEWEGTHIWVCDACPFVGMEFYFDKDADNVADRLKRSLKLKNN